MAKTKTKKAEKSPLVELQFPVGGLNRQAGFDQQPPYTTPYCVNVRPYDVVNLASTQMHGMRQRGGARPGLVKVDATDLGGPIQMLNYASLLNSNGTSSHTLLAISSGSLYQNNNGTLTVVTGGAQFNTAATQLQSTQVGQKFYIADHRTNNLAGKNGTIASTNRLSDTDFTADWGALDITPGVDVVWISGKNDLESNIFAIATVTTSYITFTLSSNTMAEQTGGVIWQIGRMVKVFDPAKPTTALSNLADGTLPIAATHFTAGTITIGDAGVVSTLSTPYFPHFTQAVLDAGVILTVPNVTGIGTTDYLVTEQNFNNNTIVLADKTGDAKGTWATGWNLSWTGTYYGLPPLGCNLCCTYRGRLVLAGPGSVWYMSRVLNPNDWDYGYDPADPSRAVAGTSTTTGGIPDTITALMPHSDQYLIFGCEQSLWMLTSDPAYGGTISALSRDVGVLGPNAWCNLPDGSIVFLSRDGLYQIAAGGQSYPQSISRKTLPAELLDVDWVNNTVSLSYDIWARGLHLAITPVAGTVGRHFFLDWTVGGFWPVALPDTMQPTAMVRYSPSSTTPSEVLQGGYDGYVRKYLVTPQAGTGADWAQGTGGTPRGVLTPLVSPAWVANALAGQKFIVGTSSVTCYSNTATYATMTTAGPANDAAASWSMESTDDGTTINSLVTYGPFQVGGSGYYGEILQICANLDVNGKGASWGIFGGETGQDALQAAVTAGIATGATNSWTGAWVPGNNHRQYPRAVGVALLVMVSGTSGWAIEGMQMEGRKRGPQR